MKKSYTIGCLFMIILLVSVLGACQKSSVVTETKNTLTAYFYNPTDGTLFGESVAADLDPTSPKDKMIDILITALCKGPQSNNTLQVSTMPIKKVDLKDLSARITFDKSYNDLSSQEQIAIRVSVVYTLTQLDFVDTVEFFIEDKPLMNLNSDEIGPISRNDIIINRVEPNPPTTPKVVNLYFANSTNTKLVKEQRTILVNNSILIEKYIVEELIKGPTTEGLLPTVPKETKVNDIKTTDGVCQVDLSVDLKSKHFTSPDSKKLMIYSIVNSLTDLPEAQKSKVQKVAFLIDGKKEVEFSKDIDLSEFLERNESLIEQN